MAEENKGGFLKKIFGGKSKAEKLAAEAAERAAKQKLVDEQMAARMAAINAAALKSAREQDMRAAGIDPETAAEAERAAAIEADEAERARAQALEDVARAKQLAEEKRALEEAHRAEQDRLAQERLAAEAQAKREREARAKAEAERLERLRQEAQRRRDAEQAARAAAEQAEREKSEQAAQLREAARQAEIERIKTDREAQKTQASLEALDRQTEKGFLDRISHGLRKSTSQMSDNMAAMFTKRKLDDEAIEELEDLLVAADFGIGPASRVTHMLAKDRFDKQVTDMEIKIALADVISDILTPLEKPLVLGPQSPQILLFVGVNGSGKTTTLGKFAKRFADQGKKVLIVAGDTFRAAADEQLKVWGMRAGAPVMSGRQGADAAGLVYDAITRAKQEGFDILMIDTAGRLQNRKELMEELSKVVRVIKKHDESAPHHCILVLDATVGQNALSQTEAFKSTAGVTGLIMTKLDGTAKGGVLVALSDKYHLPIHAIGIGERIEDLENFSAPVFAAALSGVADAVIDSQ